MEGKGKEHGLTYCSPGYKHRNLGRTALYCSKCGYHIRGKNHNEGMHHKLSKKG